MESFSINSILKSIENLLGKGPHQLHEPSLGKEEIAEVADSIKKNFVSTKGTHVQKFEKLLTKYTKSKYVTTIINGTQAIFIALKALGVKEGEEVLVPALTFVGTVNAISYIGAEPHFVDSHIENFGIDVKKLDLYLSKKTVIRKNKCINKFSGKIIKAIIPVHVFGQSCDIDGIIKLSKKYKLLVIEDAAECIGSFYNKKHLGTFGHAGCLSFNGNKIITTGGGGAILTKDKRLDNKIKHLVTTAKVRHNWEFIHNEIGYNYRMPSINAALGIAQIRKIKTFINLKRKLFLSYKKIFKKKEGIQLYTEKKNSRSNYWLQNLILKENYKHLKNKLIRTAYKKKIYMRPVWKIISDLKPYKQKQKMDLTGAKNIYDTTISLPSSQNLFNLIKKNEKK